MKTKLRVKYVSTLPPDRCGIAEYVSRHIEAMQTMVDVGSERVIPGRGNPLVYVRMARAARRGADVVHVHYSFEFMGTIRLGPLHISGVYTPLFYHLVKHHNGPRLVTTMHEIVDPTIRYKGSIIRVPITMYYRLLYGYISRYSDVVHFHTEESREVFEKYV